MYSAFEELGILWNEVWAAHDPIPRILAGGDLLGLAFDRKQIVVSKP